MLRKPTLALTVAALFAVAALGACAPKPATPEAAPSVAVSPAPTEITKTIFSQHDVDPDLELYLYEVIIPAGEEIPAHTHPGLQMAHIAEGSLEYEVIEGTAIVVRAEGTADETTEEVSGQTVTLEAGDGVIEEEGMVHQARNPGDVPTCIVLSSLFERGAELSSPVPVPVPSPSA